MGQFSLTNLFGMTIRESATDGSDFTNPDADYRRLFLGEDGLLHVKDSAGTVSDPYTGGSSAAAVGVRVYRTAAQSISNVTLTGIQFDNESYDTDAFHDNVTNNTRLTVPTGKDGKYSIRGACQWANNATGHRIISIRLNGATVITEAEIPGFSGIDGPSVPCSTDYALVATDYVELMVYQNSTASLNTRAAAAGVHFEMHRIGT